MPRYVVNLRDYEVQDLKKLIQKGGKDYRIKHAQILFALERKKQQNRYRKVTGDVKAKICMIACSDAPEGYSRQTMQAIADELVLPEIVDSISDSTICNVMKKTRSSHGL